MCYKCSCDIMLMAKVATHHTDLILRLLLEKNMYYLASSALLMIAARFSAV